MKNRNSRRRVGFVSYLSTLAGLGLCPATQALDVSFEPRLETGALYYQFSQEDLFVVGETNVEGVTGFSVSSFMPFVGGGVTVFLDRFFLDLYAQGAFNGEDSISQQNFQGSQAGDSPAGLFSTNENDEFDRQEYSVSLGYAVTPSTALYFGYKRAEFSIEGTGDITANIGGTNLGTLPWQATVDYTNDGFFIGGVQAWNVDWKGPIRGALSLNFGVGFLSGDIEQTSQIADGPPSELEFEGDTVGLNLGANWKAPITKKLAYSIGVSGYQYNFDADRPTGGTAAANFSEALIKFSVGLSYLF